MRHFRISPGSNDICSHLVLYTTYSGNFLPKFWDKLSVPFMGQEFPFLPGFLGLSRCDQ
jgi:hypothetical protein